jgi:hypothetical protein
MDRPSSLRPAHLHKIGPIRSWIQRRIAVQFILALLGSSNDPIDTSNKQSGWFERETQWGPTHVAKSPCGNIGTGIIGGLALGKCNVGFFDTGAKAANNPPVARWHIRQ